MCPTRWIWLLIGVTLVSLACGSPPEVAKPYACDDCNLLLISIDTLRADHLGAYGYPLETSPNLDDWAGGAVLFERAFSTAEKTADSHMSIFTGLHPSSHRVVNTADPAAAFRLTGGIETLTEVLKEAGFTTAGFHGGGNVESYYGFDRGFDLYEGSSRFFVDPDTRVDTALQWLDERADGRFFLFFHTYYVHDPYLPQELPPELSSETELVHDMAEIRQLLAEGGFNAVRDRFWSAFDGSDPADVAKVVALYDSTIRETDRFISRLIREVQSRAPNTMVVLVSDHGEAFQEHGVFNHTQLYNEVIHVPLIIGHPRLEQGMRIGEIVSLVDLAPTLLELLGQRALSTGNGQSFAALLSPDSQSPENPRPAYSEKLWYPDPKVGTPAAAIRSMVFPDETKVIHQTQQGLEYYDLRSDPSESAALSDQAQVPPDKLQALSRLARQSEALGEELYRGQEQEAVPLDEEAESQLRALGYIE